MTRYEALKALVQKWRNDECGLQDEWGRAKIECAEQLEAALALPEDSKVVNAELYGLAVELADWTAKHRLELAGLNQPLYRIERNSLRYLELREASGEPMPYKVVRDGDKVRFE